MTKTYGEAAKTPGTKLHRMLEANEKAHAERMKMTDAEREAYWKNAVKAR
jgi:hypothetical protein